MNEKEHIQFEFYFDDVQQSCLKFGLQFIDYMSNEYLQIYSIKYTKQSIKIESGYPIFMGQTHALMH